MLAEVLQALEVYLLAGVQASGNLSDLICLDSNNDLYEDKGWPTTLGRLGLGFKDRVQCVRAVDHAIRLRIGQRQENFVALLIIVQLVSNDGDPTIPLMESLRILSQCLDNGLVDAAAAVYLTRIDIAPIPELTRNLSGSGEEHAGSRGSSRRWNRSELLGRKTESRHA